MGAGASAWRGAAILGAVLALLVTPAQVARAGEDLTVEGTTRYRLDVDDRLVRVRMKVKLTNNLPSRRVGNFIQTPYFDSFGFPALGPVKRLDVRSSGGRKLSVDVDQRRRGFQAMLVDLEPNLVNGSPQTITVEFDLPGQQPRSKSATRVNDAFASFFVYGAGDPGKIDIEIALPEAYELTLPNPDLRTQYEVRGSRRVHTIVGVRRAEDAAMLVSARADDRLTSEQLSVDDVDVEVKAWPDDARWGRFVTRVLERGLPLLEGLVGLQVPGDELTVVEASSVYHVGYAGFYDPLSRLIEVGDELDRVTMLHELSHLWFNDRVLFRERWINEGLAEEVANRAVAEMGDKPLRPKRIRRGAPAASPLNRWSALDPSQAAAERFSYNASFAVMHKLAAQMGADGLRAVVRAASRGDISYQGDTPREQLRTRRDWRYFYDLAELVGGADGIDDLFVRHVLTDRQAASLTERAAARAALDDLTEAAGGWTAPLAIREEMARWQFDAAENLIAEAYDVVERAAGVADQLEAVGVDAAELVETTYETAADPAAAAATLTEIQELGEEVAGVRERRDSASLVARLGMVGADVDLEEVAGAIAAGDLAEARSALADVSSIVDRASARGGALLAAALLSLAAVVAVPLLIRRIRRRQAAPPPALDDWSERSDADV